MRGAVRCGAEPASAPGLVALRLCPPLRAASPAAPLPWIAASAPGCPAHTVPERQAWGSGAALAELDPFGPWEQKGRRLSKG